MLWVTGSGPYLIHGSSGNTRDMTFDFIAQVRDRYRVIVFDRPGPGWTDRLPKRAEGIHEQAALLRMVSQAPGVENPIVLGHSYGAAVALAWALDSPDSVAAAMNVSGPSHPWPGPLPRPYRVNSNPVGAALSVPPITAFASGGYVDKQVASIFSPRTCRRAMPPVSAHLLTLLRANASRRATQKTKVTATPIPPYRSSCIPRRCCALPIRRSWRGWRVSVTCHTARRIAPGGFWPYNRCKVNEANMSLPFDGAISAFYDTAAPEDIRTAIREGDKKDILAKTYPYDRWMKKSGYEGVMDTLQLELVKLQADVKTTGKRIVVLFEGRDAAGKGGAIARIRKNLNPRSARVVALSKPSDTEAGQWYFQCYVEHLPTQGEIAIFDRSWYNRAVVEHVFEFCTPPQRASFFRQLPAFEDIIADEGIIFIKLWLNVGRAEQLRRFLAREQNPLKQWKLSWIDVEGLKRWDAYSAAIGETFERSHTDVAPWTVIRADDKYRARISAIQTLLSTVDYAGKIDMGAPDPQVCGTPEIWHG